MKLNLLSTVSSHDDSIKYHPQRFSHSLNAEVGDFEDKLLRLPDELHTDPARELAADRLAVLERFREQFIAEWHGER